MKYKPTDSLRSQPQPVEWLVFRGMLSADLRLMPTGSFSSSRLPVPPTSSKGGPVTLELRDVEDRLLQREVIHTQLPQICHNIDPGFKLLDGRIAYIEGAKELVVSKDGQIISRFDIGDRPQLALTWPYKRVRRGQRYTLKLEISPPGPGAFLLLGYRWAADRYRTIGISPPENNISLDFSHLPGGRACRLYVAYTSGFRTVTAVSNAFAVSTLAPNLQIIQPRDDRPIFAGIPVTLEGMIIDDQNGPAVNEDFIWLLDNRPVQRGRISSAGPLDAGSYRVTLCYSGKKKHNLSRQLNVVAPPLQK